MPTLNVILDDKRAATVQVSSQTRSIALGMIAISWAMITAHDAPLSVLVASVPLPLIIGPAAFSILGLVCDFFQYIFQTAVITSAENIAIKTHTQEAGYNPGSIASRIQLNLFRLKIVSVAISFILAVAMFVEIGTFAKTHPRLGKVQPIHPSQVTP